jgi:hypothetical protein
MLFEWQKKVAAFKGTWDGLFLSYSEGLFTFFNYQICFSTVFVNYGIHNSSELCFALRATNFNS